VDNHNDLVEISVPSGVHRLAVYRVAGTAPTVVYVHGFRSHGRGTKALALAQCARGADLGFVSFDQRGSGRSSGKFRDFTISGGLADLLAVLDYLAPAPVVLVGSSLGGVLAVAAVPQLGSRLAGLVLIAPAFGLLSHYFDGLASEQLAHWAETGVLTLRDEYGPDHYELGIEFYRDAQQYRAPAITRFPCPVVVMHGENDELLPVADSVAFAGRIEAPQVSLFIVPGGDHRLTDALPLLCSQLLRLCRTPPDVF